MTFEQALQGINVRAVKPCISSEHGGSVNVAWGDAHVSAIEENISAELLRGMLTANGGEPVWNPSNW